MATATDIKMKIENPVVRHVTVGLGYTLNLGNFESMRFDYSVTDTVRSGELIEEAIARVEGIVEAKLVERLKEERESL
jgi:methyl coenzyme M reductase subunit D